MTKLVFFSFRAIGKLVAATHKEEPNCLNFKVYEPRQSPNGGRTFWLIEQWPSQAALEQHIKTPHVQEFLAIWETIKEKDREVTRLEPAQLLWMHIRMLLNKQEHQG